MLRKIVTMVGLAIAMLGCRDRSQPTAVVQLRPGAASLTFQNSIAQVRRINSGFIDLFHCCDVRSGSYIVSAPPVEMSSGNWEGGIRWVGDTLFEARFSKWVYSYAASCQVSPPLTKSSTSAYVNFMSGGCGASYAQVHYSIRKAFVGTAPDPEGTYPSTPSHTATIYGPRMVKPSANCFWYVSSSVGGDDVAYQWLANDEIVGSAIELWHAAGSSNFQLTATASNSLGHWASTTIDVVVDDDADDCYVE